MPCIERRGAGTDDVDPDFQQRCCGIGAAIDPNWMQVHVGEAKGARIKAVTASSRVIFSATRTASRVIAFKDDLCPDDSAAVTSRKGNEKDRPVWAISSESPSGGTEMQRYGPLVGDFPLESAAVCWLPCRPFGVLVRDRLGTHGCGGGQAGTPNGDRHPRPLQHVLLHRSVATSQLGQVRSRGSARLLPAGWGPGKGRYFCDNSILARHPRMVGTDQAQSDMAAHQSPRTRSPRRSNARPPLEVPISALSR